MASRKQNEMKQRLLEERDSLLKQRDALDNRIAGIERAIELTGKEETSKAPARKKRSSNKALVLDLLEEVGTTGLNAAKAVEMAHARGVSLDKASVSSLLSRLKGDGAIKFDGQRYRLTKHVVPDNDPNNILDLPNPDRAFSR